MRTIKFRAIKDDMSDFRFVYGSLIYDYKDNPRIQEDSNEPNFTTCVDGSECQFTGLKDKNGNEIYEGDIVKYFYLKRYTQQSHYDVRPEIDELIIKKVIDKVVFKNGCFIMSKNDDTDENYGYFSPISDYGLHSIESVKEDIFGEMLSQLDEEEQSGDCNGQDIDESIIGIEIIGNIHENPELLNP